MLPTEERFKRLTDLQKYFLFQGWLHQPTSDEVRFSFISEVLSKALVTKDDEENFMTLGYEAEQIERMKNELAKAGLR